LQRNNTKEKLKHTQRTHQATLLMGMRAYSND